MKNILSLLCLFSFTLAQASPAGHYHDDRAHNHKLPTAGLTHSHNGGSIGSSENTQTSAGGCSPNINVANGSSGHITFNCKPDEKPATSNLKKQSTELVTGDWEFKYEVYKSMDHNGVSVDENKTRKLVFRFHVKDNEIIGNLIGRDSKNTCGDMRIKGSIDGRKIMFGKLYTGNCCRDAQINFEGEVEADNQNIKGKAYPSKAPPFKNCHLWWANVSARKL